LEKHAQNHTSLSSLEKANRHNEQSNEKLELLINLSHSILEAKDETEVVDLLLTFNIEFIGVCGASFVPMDSYGKPLAIIKKGELPDPQVEAWIEYIATPEIRNKCSSCSNYGIQTEECFLLDYHQIAIKGNPCAEKILCLPIKYANKDLGILNLFLPSGKTIERTENIFLMTILEQTAIAIEAIRLGKREQNLVDSIENYKQTHESVVALTSLINNLQDDHDNDFICLIVFANSLFEEEIKIVSGDLKMGLEEVINSIVFEIKNTKSVVLISSADQDNLELNQDISIIAAPLLKSNESILGVLVTGKAGCNISNQEQISLVQTTASNIAFMLQYSSVLADVEYHAIIQERRRLAREIHDGLAQTLGFLKLQAAKMRNLMVSEDPVRFQENIDLHYKALGAAYLDVREAIDNLHLSPSRASFGKWLPEQIKLFSEMSDIRVDLDFCEFNFDMPIEIEAQLIRIFQEALSNVRKHSKADRVLVNCIFDVDYLNIDIFDNGIGFSTEDVTYVSQYGLMGMYERAQLIGADLQINSVPNKGTTVHIQVPIKNHQQELLA